MHYWTEDEIEELLRAAVLEEEDCWGYCLICGRELSPVEADAEETWCDFFSQVMRIENLRSLGYV